MKFGTGWAGLVLIGPLACGGVVPADGGDDDSSGSVDSTGPSDPNTDVSTDEGTSSGDPPQTSTETTASGDDSSEDTGVEPPMCPSPDAGFGCNPVYPDCPSGTKCTVFDFDADGSEDGSSCLPLTEDPLPLYAECTPDPRTCVDPCGPTALCQLVGSDGTGVCIDSCSASSTERDATCPDPATVCLPCSACSVQPCLPSCNPLDPQCPDLLPLCYYTDHRGPVCTTQGGEVAEGPGAPCEDFVSCPQGTHCIPADAYGPACEASACCTPFCDLDDGEPGCSEAGQVCVAVDPTAPPGDLEGLGWCLSEDFDPCAEPGSCPPDAFDPNYPWCSGSNEAFCPEGGAFAFGNDCIEQCWCHVPCERDADCPAAATGDATPECQIEPGAANCVLRCDEGQTCPDGMQCSEAYSPSICMWQTTLDTCPE